MKKKKKIIVLVSFCLLLVLTGTVNVLLNNYALTEASKAESNAVVVGNFFTNYRADRVETRAEEKLYLEAIIASENISAEAKANAEADKRAEKDLWSIEDYDVFSDVYKSIYGVRPRWISPEDLKRIQSA